MSKFALYVRLKPKPGKEKDVEAFLKQGAQMRRTKWDAALVRDP